jgi:hypothetical protein
MKSDHDKRRIKSRAKQIKKANKAQLSTKDYIQRGLVVLIIIAILAAALYFTGVS